MTASHLLIWQTEDFGELDDSTLAPRPEELPYHGVDRRRSIPRAQLVRQLVVSHVEDNINAAQAVKVPSAHDVVRARQHGVHVVHDQVHEHVHVAFEVQVAECEVEVDNEMFEPGAPYL